MARRGCPLLQLSKRVAVWREATDFLFTGGVLVVGENRLHLKLLEKVSTVISAVFTMN